MGMDENGQKNIVSCVKEIFTGLQAFSEPSDGAGRTRKWDSNVVRLKEEGRKLRVQKETGGRGPENTRLQKKGIFPSTIGLECLFLLLFRTIQYAPHNFLPYNTVRPSHFMSNNASFLF